MKTTAERLQEIMKERNLKQADVIEMAKPFAERYGAKLTRHDMSQYCAGKVAPTQKSLPMWLGKSMTRNMTRI